MRYIYRAPGCGRARRGWAPPRAGQTGRACRIYIYIYIHIYIYEIYIKYIDHGEAGEHEAPGRDKMI